MKVHKQVYRFISKNAQEIIALSALGLAIWQGLALRTHSRLSLRPHLKFEHHVSTVTPQVSITLSNNGVGPAYITSFKVFVDDKPVSSQPKTLWNDVLSHINLPFIWGGGKEIHGKYSIASDKTITIFKAKTTNDDEDVSFNLEQAHYQIERIYIIVEYESAYGDKFIEEFNKT